MYFFKSQPGEGGPPICSLSPQILFLFVTAKGPGGPHGLLVFINYVIPLQYILIKSIDLFNNPYDIDIYNMDISGIIFQVCPEYPKEDIS